MKTLKGIITGKKLDKLGITELKDMDDLCIYEKGNEKYILKRLKGKTERYKVMHHYRLDDSKLRKYEK